VKVSFAHMGTSHVVFQQLLERLGHEVIPPPAPTKRTLTLGAQHAPEFACIPFKMVLGTYLEVADKGVELIITSGGVGPCRAGLYGMVHQSILASMGYRCQIMVFDPPLTGMASFIHKVGRVIKSGNSSWLKFYRELKLAWHKLRAIDYIENYSHQVRPYEMVKGDTSRAFSMALDLLDQAYSLEEVDRAQKKSLEIIDTIPRDLTRQPLKIGIIGEIYVVLEPFINMDIEKTLGEMGVMTHRSIYLTGYTQHNVMDSGEHDLKEIAKPYLSQPVGGHGVNSIGETILYAQKGFDGVIQLAPFTCIPEIVAKSILPRVSRDFDIPVLTITIDEQTGKAGIQTRLEAFIDLLVYRRNNRRTGNHAWISGY